MNPQAFRRKPLDVLAMRLISRIDVESAWMWVNTNGGKASQSLSLFGDEDDVHLSIRTPERTVQANIGDWVVRTGEGEFWPVRNEIFKATYEPVAL